MKWIQDDGDYSLASSDMNFAIWSETKISQLTGKHHCMVWNSEGESVGKVFETHEQAQKWGEQMIVEFENTSAADD